MLSVDQVQHQLVTSTHATHYRAPRPPSPRPPSQWSTLSTFLVETLQIVALSLRKERCWIAPFQYCWASDRCTYIALWHCCPLLPKDRASHDCHVTLLTSKASLNSVVLSVYLRERHTLSTWLTISSTSLHFACQEDEVILSTPTVGSPLSLVASYTRNRYINYMPTEQTQLEIDNNNY